MCLAGPILAQHSEPLRSDERAPDLLERMMVKGMGMLLDRLPGVLAGEITEKDARPQGEEQVTRQSEVWSACGDRRVRGSRAAQGLTCLDDWMAQCCK